MSLCRRHKIYLNIKGRIANPNFTRALDCKSEATMEVTVDFAGGKGLVKLEPDVNFCK